MIESGDLTLRPATDEDLPFLARVYASTREEELRVVPWTEPQKAEFLRMQFEAQHTHYRRHFGDAQFDVILERGEPIGRLYVHRRAHEIRIIDIALLTAFRGRGCGRRLLQQILDEGAALRLPVTIHVELNNPAKRLYKQLGFRRIEASGLYELMEWTPPPAVEHAS